MPLSPPPISHLSPTGLKFSTVRAASNMAPHLARQPCLRTPCLGMPTSTEVSDLRQKPLSYSLTTVTNLTTYTQMETWTQFQFSTAYLKSMQPCET